MGTRHIVYVCVCVVEGGIHVGIQRNEWYKYTVMVPSYLYLRMYAMISIIIII